MCPYAYYNEEEKKSKIYCKINDGICLFSRYCIKVDKYVLKDNMESCYIMAENEKKKNTPQGANYVRFVRNGYLYVEFEDRVVKIKDTLGNVTNYVYVRKTDNDYEISLTPFVNNIAIDKPKKRTTRKKDNV